MTLDAKRLIQMAFLFSNHYDIINHKKQGCLTVRFWLSNYEFLSVTTHTSLDPGTVCVRFGHMVKSSHMPTARVTQLDKLFGKSKRKPYTNRVIVNINRVLSVIQSLDFSGTDSDPVDISKDYPAYPEKMYW